MSYEVKAPLVIVKNEDGTDRYFYQGAILPDGLDKDHVKQLVESEMIGRPEATPKSGDDDSDGPPAKSASKADWEAYARSQGATDEDLDGKTKDDLVAAYGD